MATNEASPRKALTPPRSAAIAGVLFSVLMGAALIIIRIAVPPYQKDTGEWISDASRLGAVSIAVHLVPFAGIAFIWFIGVFRHRVGVLEDQFFSSVFLGSGLLFVASLFAAAALSGALVETASAKHIDVRGGSEVFYLIRHMLGAYLNIFAIKMAGVFIMSTSTIVWRTKILPRWLALLGFACAILLLLVITNWPWIALLFPLWMLVLSASILFTEFHPPKEAAV